jgi:hypothetical protein
MTGYYGDDEMLDYPRADQLVKQYIDTHAARHRTTSVDVLAWSEYENNHHNRKRVYDALRRFATETDSNHAGRTVFQIANR